MGRTVIALALFCAALAWSPSMDKSSIRIARISNEDIDWDGNIFGLYPMVSGRTEEIERTLAKEDVPELLRALDDPKRFVAAHVLLADVVPCRGKLGGSSWLGLDVDWKIKEHGVDVYKYNTKNIPTLRRWWQNNVQQAAGRLDDE